MSQESPATQPQPQPQPSGQPAAMAFDRDEWELLVTLPRRVVVAATSAEPDSPRRTVAEGLAGIEAIAAGRSSPSRLVREVVAAIYAAEDAEEAEDLAAEVFNDQEAGLAQTLEACRHASAMLQRRVKQVDADGYRAWLAEVAAAVCGAAHTGGFLGIGGARVSVAESRFLDDLADALAV